MQPKVDLDVCVKTADECCHYYANILEDYEACRVDPNSLDQQRVAKAWRSLL
jgi:hypothetical protein